jgi:pyruvate/2-oxoglutarate dehydrogenase complex dihydrolipoamide dehydrogenase (E3) component
MLHEVFTEEGIGIVTSAHIARVDGKSGEWVKLHAARDGAEIILEGTHLLVASGRTPNTQGIGLEWPEWKQPTVVT